VIQPLFEHRTTLAGFQTRVLELEGEGPPLVFFHGYADSADTWRETLALLARRGRRAVAVDLPGFGMADNLTDGRILPQLDEFSNAALRYFAPRGRRAIVVGNSLGGCVALRLAGHRHPRLEGVVAVAPAGLEMSRILAVIEADPVIHSLLNLPAPVPGMVIRAAVARLFRELAVAAPSRLDPRVIPNFTWHIRSRPIAARYVETAHRLVAELRDPFRLDRIECPVLLIWGDRDRLVFPRGARRVLDAVETATLELLPGVGHMPQHEAPERLVQLLGEFLVEPQTAAAA
jgi:pimeloyl-ACP methyl ester carboxylesterase